MLLGKKYTRLKRRLNAAELYVTFVTQDDKSIRLPRKLNMLAVLSIHEKVSPSAVSREIDKFKRKLKQQEV